MIRFAGVLAGVLLLAAGQAWAGEGSGTFSGLEGHEASGGVKIVRTDSGWEVRLQDDFRFDGAPDARVGFGSGGHFANATDFEPLRANSGSQVYEVPADIDPREIRRSLCLVPNLFRGARRGEDQVT